MLQGEMPFGSWRESEIDIVAKIAKGQLSLPQNLSPEAVDLLTKVAYHNYLFLFYPSDMWRKCKMFLIHNDISYIHFFGHF